MKICPSCHKDLSENLFNIARLRKDGCSVYCKKCTHEKYVKKYNSQVSDKICRCGKTFSGLPNSKVCGPCKTHRQRKPITGHKECLYCKKLFPYRDSLKVRSANGVGSAKQKFCSIKCALLFRNSTPKMREISRTNGLKNKGRTHVESDAVRRRKSEMWRGERSHFWKGGVTSENRKIRSSVEIGIWKRSVFKRDNWTCQECGARSKTGNPVILHAHHIKAFADYPELRTELNNGITLCLSCHEKTDTYRKSRK